MNIDWKIGRRKIKVILLYEKLLKKYELQHLCKIEISSAANDSNESTSLNWVHFDDMYPHWCGSYFRAKYITMPNF